MFIKPTGADLMPKASAKVAEVSSAVKDFVASHRPIGAIDPKYIVKDVYVSSQNAKSVDIPENVLQSVTEFYG